MPVQRNSSQKKAKLIEYPPFTSSIAPASRMPALPLRQSRVKRARKKARKAPAGVTGWSTDEESLETRSADYDVLENTHQEPPRIRVDQIRVTRKPEQAPAPRLAMVKLDPAVPERLDTLASDLKDKNAAAVIGKAAVTRRNPNHEQPSVESKAARMTPIFAKALT